MLPPGGGKRSPDALVILSRERPIAVVTAGLRLAHSFNRNAVADALSPFGVKLTRLPLSPSALFDLLKR